MLPPRTTTTHPAGKRTVRRRAGLAAVVVLTALAGSAPAMATPIPTTGGNAPTSTVNPAGAPTQGIIMRDGGVCDPIRHMGC